MSYNPLLRGGPETDSRGYDAAFHYATVRTQGDRSGRPRRMAGARVVTHPKTVLDRAVEVSAVNERDARRDDVAVQRTGCSNVDLLTCRDTPGHGAPDRDDPGANPRRDPRGRADRQNVRRQLDRAADLAIKGQIFE